MIPSPICAPLWCEVPLRGVMRRLILPSAAALIRARAEAEVLEDGSGQQALFRNACLLAQALTDGRSPLFSSGAQVLDTLTPDEIEALTEQFHQLRKKAPPSPDSPVQDGEDYKAKLKADANGRLRWKVMKAFRALPTERRVLDMTPEDYLYCALNLILDQEEGLEELCPRCRSQRESRCACCGTPLADWSGEENPNFDRGRFAALGREVAK